MRDASFHAQEARQTGGRLARPRCRDDRGGAASGCWGGTLTSRQRNAPRACTASSPITWFNAGSSAIGCGLTFRRVASCYSTRASPHTTYCLPDLSLRSEVKNPHSLGIVAATRGYLDLSHWEKLIAGAIQAGRRPRPAQTALRCGPYAPAPCSRIPQAASRRRVLRRCRHDMDCIWTAQAIRRHRNRATCTEALRMRCPPTLVTSSCGR